MSKINKLNTTKRDLLLDIKSNPSIKQNFGFALE